MGLTYQAEQDQARSMQDAVNQNRIRASERRQNDAMQKSIKDGIAEGVKNALAEMNKNK